MPSLGVLFSQRKCDNLCASMNWTKNIDVYIARFLNFGLPYFCNFSLNVLSKNAVQFPIKWWRWDIQKLFTGCEPCFHSFRAISFSFRSFVVVPRHVEHWCTSTNSFQVMDHAPTLHLQAQPDHPVQPGLHLDHRRATASLILDQTTTIPTPTRLTLPPPMHPSCLLPCPVSCTCTCAGGDTVWIA